MNEIQKALIAQFKGKSIEDIVAEIDAVAGTVIPLPPWVIPEGDEKAWEDHVTENESTDWSSKLACPVCNKIVSDFEKGESNPCVHTKLIYFDAVNTEFVYVSDEMTGVADDMVVKFNEDEDAELYDVMEEFADISNGEYRVEELTTCGMSCGPCSNTEYILFKVK